MAWLAHGDYFPLMNLVLPHWQQVNAALGGTGVVVLEGVDQAAGVALRAALSGKGTEVTRLENGVEFASADLALARERVMLRLEQFHAAVRAWWGDVPITVALPGMPQAKAAVDKLAAVLREVLWLWDRLNAGPVPTGGPLALPLKLGMAADFDRAAMGLLAAEWTTKRDALEGATLALRIGRAERAVLEDRVRKVLVKYAQLVRARLAASHPLLNSLPRLNPLPGHTPKGVALTGIWDAARQAARLDWAESAEPTLAAYQVRMCRGGSFAKRRERMVATVPAGEARHLWATVGLEAPGAVVCYKVYVVLKTGNERGSAVLRMKHPSSAG